MALGSNEVAANFSTNISKILGYCLIWLYKDHQYSLNIDDHSRP